MPRRLLRVTVSVGVLLPPAVAAKHVLFGRVVVARDSALSDCNFLRMQCVDGSLPLGLLNCELLGDGGDVRVFAINSWGSGVGLADSMSANWVEVILATTREGNQLDRLVHQSSASTRLCIAPAVDG